MTTLEPEQKDILEKLNQLALEENWGTVDRVHTAECPNGIPKGVAVIQEAIEEIKRLRMRIINWRNDIEADEKVRKETAKAISHKIVRTIEVCKGDKQAGNNIVKNEAQITILQALKNTIAKEYGVEIENE